MFELGNLLLLILPSSFVLILYISKSSSLRTTRANDQDHPQSYPIIGHSFAALKQKDRFQWLTKLLIDSPTSTFIFRRPFGVKSIQTADPAVVEHILKTRFPIYQKGPFQKSVLGDLLGDGIFNADSETWKFQRQVASYEFNTKSLRKFVEDVVEHELTNRLLPMLSEAAKNGTILDLQNILRRFAFDNICKIGFGYDPEYLSPSLPEEKFAAAFEEAVTISTSRFQALFPVIWKITRFLNIGSEKRLKQAVVEIRGFANSLVRKKKQEMMKNTSDMSSKKPETEDLLSRFLKSGYSDEKFVTDIVISFILAGRDTTSAALTWFFWLLNNNDSVEEEIVHEIKQLREQKKEHCSVFEEVKDMAYIHAALCESMRLYPPVAVDLKEAVMDDMLPGGIPIRKGTRVSYHPYAMGRLEKLWGVNWAEFKPQRWLEVESFEVKNVKRRFVPRDPYMYPVFQAGPRICLGKEMAFLQMKMVVAGVLERFRVIPVVKEGFEPVYVPQLTAKMQGGLPVRIEERVKF
ncbi:cytochrome P450 94A2-like [Chenopodium quinoa]|uniref:cytochrome P450 94A2-like n=1 Tax=Chenopodium quinoa TaxID=63459 RepID=UPI000B783BCE|nr:cytochrome P450 94A2-like [Chenopodium quinoa]